MVELIVDIQGFYVTGYTLVPKEIAVLSRCGQKLEHFLIKSPFAWGKLDRQSKKSAIWLEQNHHGLRWSGNGNIPYNEMCNIFTNIIQKASKLYVKGAQKKAFLELHNLSCEIIDLDTMEDYSCISVKKSFSHRSCFAHDPPYTCALSNVYKIKKWLDDGDFLENY